MKYTGSKNRIAKDIIPIMISERRADQCWVEPFVGGANVIDKIEGRRIGGDLNPQVIGLLKKMQTEWNPPKELSEDLYNKIKNNKDKYPNYVLGYAGFQLSYGAVYFSSYRKDKSNNRDYAMEAYNNIMKQKPKIKDVEFHCCSYLDLEIPDKSIIYCDIPYKSTDRGAYRGNGSAFDHEEFWDWCRMKKNQGHTVFISEYEAPEDFTCIWEKKITQSINNTKKSKKPTEKLFTLK